MSWTPPPDATFAPPTPLGWARVALKGPVVAVTVFGGLAVLLALRLFERPLAGHRRPVTPWITVAVCRIVLAVMGLRPNVQGAPLAPRAALVANHTSWLDIFVLNSLGPLTFVSKAEVAGWPGIGWLARATGTLFIRRDRREARAQADALAERLARGERVLFFPEGTSTDGLRVLAFKPALFGAFAREDLAAVPIQPISLRYTAPRGVRADFYGWWGGMAFAPALLAILAAPAQGRVAVLCHPPQPACAERKALAARLEARVREGHAQLSP